ncbi:hypothetical protein BDD12DRAFT_890440 [Trichophaea hybrida]|nr:hypothetical protein BDD12DRAFT_890440 [Trichophaea hybrida]
MEASIPYTLTKADLLIILVHTIREVDDKKRADKNVDTFAWELKEPDKKESKIIEKIKTEASVDVQFVPSGTFYKLLAASKDCRVPDPNLKVKEQRAILALTEHDIDIETQWRKVPHSKKMLAAQTLEDTLKLSWLYEGWWLHMWILKECRKTVRRAKSE